MKTWVAWVVCVILFCVFGGERGVPALLRAKRREAELSAQIASLRAHNARLRARADLLKYDPAAVERLARETLGLARAEELVIVRAPTAR